MCNTYGLNHPVTLLNQAFSETALPLIFPAGMPNLEPRDQIRPTDPAPIVRCAGGETQFVSLRWGFQPARPKAGPVINFRSEGRRFGSNRCLVPASFFFEFTGDRYPKSKWRFTLAGDPFLCIAGLWRGAQGDWPESFTMLTTEPGPDMAPYHDRQVAVLRRADWRAWLHGGPEAELLRPLPAGSLEVVQDR